MLVAGVYEGVDDDGRVGDRDAHERSENGATSMDDHGDAATEFGAVTRTTVARGIAGYWAGADGAARERHRTFNLAASHEEGRCGVNAVRSSNGAQEWLATEAGIRE